MKWKLENTVLWIDGKPFNSPEARAVIAVVEFRDRLFVLLDWMPKPWPRDNLLCVENSGTILWRIKPYPDVGRSNSVLSVVLVDGQLFAHFGAGYTVTVDPDTGDWAESDPGARPW